MTSRYSVLIVGAGPTGLTLANLLGQAGVRTLLVEANPATVGEPRAVSIDDESLRVVQALGLLDAVEAEIVQGYGSEYRSPAGRTFLKVKPRAQPYGHPRRNAFRQPVFEAQLRAGLGRFASVEARFSTALTAFSQDADGISATLQPIGGEAVEVRADYMIACDGAKSLVREALGAAMVGSSLDERWLIVDLEDSPAPSPETIVFCDPKRPAIALPGPRVTRRYEFKLLPGEKDEAILADAAVADLLARHGAAPQSRIIRKVVYHFHARVADRWGDGRVWLAGDAAHLMPPFAGQGMNSGVRDAFNLGWKLAAVVQGRLGPGLLATYPRERRPHAWSMIRLALQMGRVMGPRTALDGWRSRAFFRLLSLWPAARSYFAEMKYKPPPRFAEGFLATGGGSLLVGRMAPQPRLGAGPDRGKRLDDLLGAGFTLVGVGLDAATVRSLSLGPDWDGLIDRRLALPVDAAPELARESGRLLLLRPDRYVMARFTPAEVAAIRVELEKLRAATWAGEG